MSDSAIVTEILHTWDKIQNGITELMDKVNWVLGKIPDFLGWIKDKILDAWNGLMDKWHEAKEKVQYNIDNRGSQGDLAAAAGQWAQNVGGPVSGESANADAGLLLVDDNWTGTAGEQYKQMLSLQKGAMEKLKSNLTDGVALALNNMGNSIQTFHTVFGTALATFAGAIVVAIGLAVTGVGTPASLLTLAVAGGALITAQVLSQNALENGARSASSVIRQKLNDNAGFPDGAWPKATLG